MYKRYVNKRAPVAAWIMDDTVPFQECSGSAASGGKKSGSLDPNTSAPIVSGAAYSSVFGKTRVAQFDQNLFKQGLEARPFALECWIAPQQPFSGITATRTNLVPDPNLEHFGYVGMWIDNTGSCMSLETSNPIHGTQSFKVSTPAFENWGYYHMQGGAGGDLTYPTHTSGHTYTAQVKVRSIGVQTLSLMDYGDSNTQGTPHTFAAGETALLSVTFTAGTNVYISLRNPDRVTLVSDFVFDEFMIEETGTLKPYFDGNYAGAEWTGAANGSTSTLLVSTGDQQILSHDGVYDGLSINGKVLRFGTSYVSSGDAFCDYDIGEYQSLHVVGMHSADQNQLWVNGTMVASVDITDEQKADTYIAAADGILYSGYSSSGQMVAMNGVAFYPSLTGDQVNQNYLAGIDVLPQARVAPQFGGLPFDLNIGDGSVSISQSWSTKDEFESGLKNDVEYAEDQIEPSYSSGLSVAGSWTVGIPLDTAGDTSLYGVMVEWTGLDVTVDVSTDGTSWSSHTSGELVSVVSNGSDPTGVDLQVRVNFAGGLADDPAYLESLSVYGLRDNNINSVAARTVTASHPAVPRGDFEPFLYRDDNGINLHGGTLTIGTDTTPDPEIARTVELWIKPLSGTPTFNVTGTRYRNGYADSTLPLGEWSLVHIAAGADISTSITVTGDCIVGQATLYPTELTSDDVEFIFKSYTGSAVVSFVETQNTLTVSEAATPAAVYAKDWSIDSAG